MAQSLKRLVAAAYIGLGANSTGHTDAFSIAAKQAALAQIKNPAMGVYREKRFLLKTANMHLSTIALPSAKGNFALQVDYFGYKNYNESQVIPWLSFLIMPTGIS